MNGMKVVSVLLVDDDAVDVMAAHRAFRKHRIANPIVEASDGVEALEILRGTHPTKTIEPPYVILLDLNMPRMSGLEFLSVIREDDQLRSAVIFVLTTSADGEDRAKAYDANVAGYIVKTAMADGFFKIAEMLESYWRIVTLP